MFKKSTLMMIILVLAGSIFPAAKLFDTKISIPILQRPVQSSADIENPQETANNPVTTQNNPSGNKLSESENPIITVHFLDVGQADSVLIDSGTYEILVDGGNIGDGPFLADYIKPYVDGDLELIVATHAHEDHIGGLSDIISVYQADQIIYSDETASTMVFQNFYAAADAEPDCIFTGDSDMTFELGNGARFQIFEMGDGYRDPNENSVVSMLDYRDVEVLLTGDLESSVEQRNLAKFSDIDVLKVSHHGSRTASSQAFLDVTKPEVSVISAGLSNHYNLPNTEVITRLLAMNSAVYGTFRSGTIVLTTDGVQYQLNTDIRLTADDAGALVH